MVTQNTRTFPVTPQKFAMELYVNSAWTDVTDDVRWAEGVAIARNRQSESALLTPSSCVFVLRNTSGNYSPRNPLGAYYGSIGRNTPMRTALVCAQDTFTRTVSNGWGSTDDGWAWTTSGGTAADFNVGGTTATMRHAARATSHFASLQSLILSDADITFAVQTGVASVTGGSLYAGVRVKSDGTHFYQFSLIVPAGGGSPFLNVVQADGTVIAPAVAIPRLTYAANTNISVRFQVEGQIFRAKAWMTATQAEPFGWDIVWSEDQSAELNNLQSGYVTLYSSVDAANTNTLPVTFTFDNVVVRAPRFAGEVSEWPQAWDTTMRYASVAVTASGPLRRLSAGGGPLDSAARRYIGSQAPYAYWPLEDGAATIAALNYAGGPPMQAIQGGNNGVGTVKWAQDATLLGGGPAPVLTQGSQLYAWVDPSAIQAAQAWTVAFGAKINRVSGTTIIMSGAGPFQVSVNLFTDGSVNVFLTQASGATLVTASATFGADSIDGLWHAYAVTVAKSGGNAVITLARDSVEYTGTVALTGQFYAVAQVVLPTPATSDSFAFSHVAVWGSDIQTAGRQAVYQSMFGWQQETVLQRLTRLCREEGIEFGYNDSVDVAFTPGMGPQRQQTLVQLLQECSNTDVGELVESRGSFGFHYHTHASLENRAAMCTLSLSGQQVSPPFAPADDDQNTRNSVTAVAPDGSSFRYQQTTGKLSILPPSQGGAGEYDSSWSANAFFYYVIRNIAAWLVGLGTVDKPRYPAMRANRAVPEVVATGWSGAFGATVRMDVMDKLVVTGMAPSGFYDDAELTVIGLNELLHTQKHELTYICTPEETRHVGVVASAGSPSAADSRLDTSGSTVNTLMNTVVTSLSVATAAGGQLWTTAAADFPFDVVAGGERMTVTNCTGATSPQTMTVTRSVNGVVKSQPVGTDVRLFHPSYVGF